MVNTRSDRSTAWRSYLLASLPGWLIGFAVVWALSRWSSVPLWVGASVVVLWVVGDLLTFPRMRKYYESQPAERRIIGERGVAATDIAPGGFARVHGELWQAAPADHWIPQGVAIWVRDIRGLELIVEPDFQAPGPSRFS